MEQDVTEGWDGWPVSGGRCVAWSERLAARRAVTHPEGSDGLAVVSNDQLPRKRREIPLLVLRTLYPRPLGRKRRWLLVGACGGRCRERVSRRPRRKMPVGATANSGSQHEAARRDKRDKGSKWEQQLMKHRRTVGPGRGPVADRAFKAAAAAIDVRAAIHFPATVRRSSTRRCSLRHPVT